MTGARHALKEKERRQSAAARAGTAARLLDARCPGAGAIALRHGLPGEDVVRVVMRHGPEVAEKLARAVVQAGRPELLDVLADMPIETFAPKPDPGAVRKLLEELAKR